MMNDICASRVIDALATLPYEINFPLIDARRELGMKLLICLILQVDYSLLFAPEIQNSHAFDALLVYKKRQKRPLPNWAKID